MQADFFLFFKRALTRAHKRFLVANVTFLHPVDVVPRPLCRAELGGRQRGLIPVPKDSGP